VFDREPHVPDEALNLDAAVLRLIDTQSGSLRASPFLDHFQDASQHLPSFTAFTPDLDDCRVAGNER
jgi:hypothetical protein